MGVGHGNLGRVTTMEMRVQVVLDHILWGAPDLRAAETLFAGLSGIWPGPGGIHDGFGTRNSLVSLGDGLFFEIIAPDPAQSLVGNRGGRLSRLSAPGLIAVSVRSSDLPSLREAAQSIGLSTVGPVAMGRTRADGVRLSWEILHFGSGQDADMVPFAIDWKGSPHPSASSPGGVTLESLIALHPDEARLAGIYKALGMRIEVRRADRIGFQAVLATPKGPLQLTAACQPPE
jgi:hypothetical protein